LLLTIGQRLGERRPHELHREPDQQGKYDHLPDKRGVDTHGLTSWSLPDQNNRSGKSYCATAARTASSSGLLKVKNRAIPTPIMVTASSRPATMNIFTCRGAIISG